MMWQSKPSLSGVSSLTQDGRTHCCGLSRCSALLNLKASSTPITDVGARSLAIPPTLAPQVVAHCPFGRLLTKCTDLETVRSVRCMRLSHDRSAALDPPVAAFFGAHVRHSVACSSASRAQTFRMLGSSSLRELVRSSSHWTSRFAKVHPNTSTT